jgi:hypothetical protein
MKGKKLWGMKNFRGIKFLKKSGELGENLKIFSTLISSRCSRITYVHGTFLHTTYL